MHARYQTGFIIGINVPNEKTDEIEPMDVNTINDRSDHQMINQ